MTTELDTLRNHSTQVLVNNTTGRIKAVYSWTDVLNYFNNDYDKLVEVLTDLEIIQLNQGFSNYEEDLSLQQIKSLSKKMED